MKPTDFPASGPLPPELGTLQEIESAVLKLSLQHQEELRDWLENLLEDQLEMKEEFKAEIKAGLADISAGRVRVRKP
jgi:predicted transcriptional regulator